MSSPTAATQTAARGFRYPLPKALFWTLLAIVALLYLVVYRRALHEMRRDWTLVDSYYTHGFLIPPIGLFFAWRNRRAFIEAKPAPCLWGYVFIAAAILFMLIGDYLGFGIFTQISAVMILPGLFLVLLGKEHTRAIWFPLAFLIFMVPLPASITQGVALRLKLLAAHLAVKLANALTLPMVQQGSYVYFGDDQLLIGEICGGLRSLIALLAFGALMSYLSKTRNWAKVLLLALSGPIAVVANVFRIFLLCVVGYFWGSNVAAGRFHDVSGILIFAVAFVLFFSIEGFLRRVAPTRIVEKPPL